ncbi:MAG TPA: glutamate ABC transporter substrate-binding protein [Streptosporangiaceae bacterium]
MRARRWLIGALAAGSAAASVLAAGPARSALAGPGAPAGRAGPAAPAARASGTPVKLPLPFDNSCHPEASLRPPAGAPRLTAGSDMARIRARGYLIAGVSESEYHQGYLNPLTGQTEGFDIDAVHQVAQAIFGGPDKVKFVSLTDAERIPFLRSGAVDIVAQSMTINCARLKQIDFSAVYFNDGQRVLVLKNSAVKGIGDLSRQRVCATAGSTSIVDIKAANPAAIPVAVPYFTDCLVLLQQGQVAAISTDGSILAGLAAQDPETQVVGPFFTVEPHGIGISQQNPDLVRFVNAVLARWIADGGWAASYAKWVSAPAPAAPVAQYKD